jgi:endoglucanase
MEARMFDGTRRLVVLLARGLARFDVLVLLARGLARFDVRSLIGASLVVIGACAQGVELLPDAEQPTEIWDAADELDAQDPDAIEDAGVTEGDSLDAGDEMDGGGASGNAGTRDSAQLTEDASGDSVQLDASSVDAAAGGSAQDAAPAYSCPGCMLKVQWNTSTTGSSTQSIAGYLKLSNTGSAPIALSGVSVRYWLRDALAESMVVECYYWDGGGGANKCTRPEDASVNAYSQLNVRVGMGANSVRYMELSFPASAGDLAPGGAAPGAMQLAFHLPNHAAMDQTDDPSFDAMLSGTGTGTGMLYDAPKISAYLGGQLAWGMEP